MTGMEPVGVVEMSHKETGSGHTIPARPVIVSGDTA